MIRDIHLTCLLSARSSCVSTYYSTCWSGRDRAYSTNLNAFGRRLGAGWTPMGCARKGCCAIGAFLVDLGGSRHAGGLRSRRGRPLRCADCIRGRVAADSGMLQLEFFPELRVLRAEPNQLRLHGSHPLGHVT